MSGALVKYDEMCRAIDAAFEVDEVKDIRDKAMAMEAYLATRHWPSLLAPKVPGVYVFVGIECVLYVGESRCVRRRLLHHPYGYLRRTPGVEIRVIPCLNHKQVERWLIAALSPSLNGVSDAERYRREHPRPTTDHDFVNAFWEGGALQALDVMFPARVADEAAA